MDQSRVNSYIRLEKPIERAEMDPRIYLHKKIPDAFSGIPVFSIMRNESYFLPHFLSHYRRLGVKSFLIYADRCSDAFVAALESQPDVSIMMGKGLRFEDAFGFQLDGRPRRLGSYLKEIVFSEVIPHQWSITVDADEFMILPPQFTDVGTFVESLDRLGQNHSSAPLVDFYPETLRLRNFSVDLDPFAGSPYFDRGPYHVRDPQTKKINIEKSGLRGRLFSRLVRQFPEALASADLASTSRPPLNFKVPLARSSPRLMRSGNHLLNIMPILANNCVLAHFKLYPGIDEKIASALQEKQYFQDSLEYRLLRCAVENMEDEDLRDDSSMLYASPADLLKAELLNYQEA